MRPNLLDQLANVHRFGQKIVDAGLEGLLPFLGHDAGRQGDHRQGVQFQLFADGPGGCQSIHHRHQNIHQDQVEAPRLGHERIQRLLTIGGLSRDRAFQFQGTIGQHPVDGAVIHDEHAQTAQSRRGTVLAGDLRRGF